MATDGRRARGQGRHRPGLDGDRNPQGPGAMRPCRHPPPARSQSGAVQCRRPEGLWRKDHPAGAIPDPKFQTRVAGVVGTRTPGLAPFTAVCVDGSRTRDNSNRNRMLYPLSYVAWRTWEDSNPRQPRFEAWRSTAELHVRTVPLPGPGIRFRQSRSAPGEARPHSARVRSILNGRR